MAPASRGFQTCVLGHSTLDHNEVTFGLRFEQYAKPVCVVNLKNLCHARTAVPAEPMALTKAFAADTSKQTWWQGCIRRSWSPSLLHLRCRMVQYVWL